MHNYLLVAKESSKIKILDILTVLLPIESKTTIDDLHYIKSQH